MNRTGNRFRDLRVWQEGMDLARAILRLTADFPATERYELTSQLRRAAVSVPSNIAEGSVRRSRREFAHYLIISLGSLAELETQLELAYDFTPNTPLRGDIKVRVERVRRMLYRLVTAIEKSNPAQ